MDTTSGFYAFATLNTLRESIQAADSERQNGREKLWISPEVKEYLEDVAIAVNNYTEKISRTVSDYTAV